MLPVAPRASTRHTVHDNGMRSAVLTPTRRATDVHHAPDSTHCPSTYSTMYVRSRHRNRCGTPSTAVTVSMPGGRFVITIRLPPDHSLALTSGPPHGRIAGTCRPRSGVPGSTGRRSRAGPSRGVEARRIHSKADRGPAQRGESRYRRDDQVGVPGTTLRNTLNDGQPFEHLFEWL